MNQIFDPVTSAIILKLCVATFCGVALGTERIIAHKTAGMRTYALVSMGAALFIVIGDLVLKNNLGLASYDPFHLASSIISGIGFLGAGVIFLRGGNVNGLTTASGLWVAAGIGMAAGYGLFSVAFIATILTLFIFIILWYIEQGIKHIHPDKSQKGPDEV